MATTTSKLGLVKPDYSDAADVGVLNANFDVLDKEVSKRTNVRGLLVNGNFRKPVNQRGKNIYAGTGGYGSLDMWILQYETNLTVNDGYITLSGMYDMKQRNTFPIKAGEVYTIAARINVLTAPQAIGLTGAGIGAAPVVLQSTGWQTIAISGVAATDAAIGEIDAAYISLQGSGNSIQIEWIDLFPGAYTSDTLPIFHNDDNFYVTELMKCKHYLNRLGTTFVPLINTSIATGSYLYRATVHLPVSMRVVPTITVEDPASGSYIKPDAIALDNSTILLHYNGSSPDLIVQTTGVWVNAEP